MNDLNICTYNLGSSSVDYLQLCCHLRGGEYFPEGQEFRTFTKNYAEAQQEQQNC